MTIMQDPDQHFRHLERKIGTFVLVATFGIVLTIGAVGVKQEVFTPKTSIHFLTDSAHDIAKGTAVKLRGFNIGKVEHLTLTDDARVLVPFPPGFAAHGVARGHEVGDLALHVVDQLHAVGVRHVLVHVRPGADV